MNRQAAVAGQFYPGSAKEIAVISAQWSLGKLGKRASALVLPHAGWTYSGEIACRAIWQHVDLDALRRVVIFCPNHREVVNGLASCSHNSFETPLGSVAIDQSARASLLKRKLIHISDPAHQFEHAIEVVLTLFQSLIPHNHWRFLPIIHGPAEAQSLSHVCQELNFEPNQPQDLLVISSDLSHFLTHHQAQTTDQQTLAQLLAGESNLDPAQACGCYALNGLMYWARVQGLRAKLLDYHDSSRASGDMKRVVGYATIGYFT